MALLEALIVLMMKSPGRTPTLEQVAFTRLKKIYCKIVQLRELGESEHLYLGKTVRGKTQRINKVR